MSLVGTLLKGTLRVVKEWLPLKQKGWKKQLTQSVSMAALVGCASLIGGSVGFYEGTGVLPFITSVAILPEVPETQASRENVVEFLEKDKTEIIDYEEGFTCEESALLVARNARWDGLVGIPISIVFEDQEVMHMALVFPTTDGWIFVEPTNDSEIKPYPGSIYWGNRIERVDILQWEWIPFLVKD